MAEEKKTATRGRPSEMTDGKRRNIYMSDTDNAYLKELGNGNVSEGLRIVTEAHRRPE